jgi:hypothetical protein
MKKFLFTLVALLAGMSAYAFNLEMRIVDNDGNPTNEIHAKAGDKINMHIELTAIDGILAGSQFQYFIQDPNGENYDATNGPVVIAKVGGSYIRPEGMSKLNGNASANNINPTDGPNAYRVVCTNTTYNVFWCNSAQDFADYIGEDVDALYEDFDPAFTDAMFTMGNVFTFRLQVNEGWTDEYAIMNFDEVFSKFAVSDGSQFQAEFPALDLKIINDDFAAPVQQLTGEIVIGDPDEDGYVAVSYTGDEDVTIRVMVDGVYVPLTDGKVFLGAYGEAEITVEVTAEGYEPLTATKTVNWEQPAIQTPAPEIVVTPGDNAYVFEAVGEGTITLFCDGVEVENPYTVARTEVDQVVKLNAVAHVDGQIDGAFDGEYIVPALVIPVEPVDLEGDIVVSEPTEDGIVTVTYTGDEDVTVTVTVNGVVVDGDIQLQDGTNEIVVTVEGDGYNTMTETFVIEWTAPEIPDDPHMTGKWIVIIDKNGQENWYEMTADPTDPNWFFMITLHHNPWGDFEVPFYFMVDGVRMGAETDMYLPGMGDEGQTILNPVFAGDNMFYVPSTYTYTFGLQLKDGQYYLLVAQGPRTAVNELVDGKTVANVRYFNMAGQEMQQADGMTIVVTTYTDGTTSATKVMK